MGSASTRVGEEWEEFVRSRYGDDPVEDPDGRAFRDYRAEARPSVREFYRENHARQTLGFVKAKKAEYLPLRHRRLGVWEAMEWLDTLVDDSDPDTSLTQIEHSIQTAEAIRRDGHPEWFVLTGLLHDMGKVLCFFDEPQWAVTGDTFPLGCAFSERVVFPEFFAANPDSKDPALSTPCGIYEEGCGLDQVHLSWGHDEYCYQVLRDYLPDEALVMVRYHSFYALHREGAYRHLMNDRDRELYPWLLAFNPYDLYSKADAPPDLESLVPYYRELVGRTFPAEISW